jgi:cob(I)alamin adenosyltransferase
MPELEPQVENDRHRQKMQRRKEVQDERLAAKTLEKGLVIVHTGTGKGKTTAALGMIFRSLGHGKRVAIIQFIKGAWQPGEKAALDRFGEQVFFAALGGGFTWETQDRQKDIEMVEQAWNQGLELIQSSDYHLVLLDEVNVAMSLGYLNPHVVVDGLKSKPEQVHVALTGRGAPAELIEVADLVTEMKLVKHPFREQGIKAQIGIEF